MTQNPLSMITSMVPSAGGQVTSVVKSKVYATIDSVNNTSTQGSSNKHATVLGGIPFSINGTVGITDGFGPSTVTVGGLDGGPLDVSVVYDPGTTDSGNWTLSQATIASLGQHSITVTPKVSSQNVIVQSDTVALQVLPATFTVQLISPAPNSNGVYLVTSTPLVINVDVTTNGPAPTDVEYIWDGGSSTRLSPPTTGQPYWTATIPLPSTVPGGGATHTLALKATNTYGTVGTLNVTVKAVDTTSPVVTVSSPADREFVPGTEQQASVEVDISVSDITPASVLSSGIQTISWLVNGTTVNTTAVAGAQSGQWTATLPLQPLDIQPQQITVTAVDVAGNPFTVQLSVTVALPLQFNDLSKQTYLRDLVDFACLRLKTSQAPGATNITPGDLQKAFHQDFDATWKAASGAASGSVHVLRLVVESLFDYLRQSAGTISWASQVAASGSTSAAYRALLLALGTSYDELRLARSASPNTRTTLASRLGFDLSPSRPDELDQLLKSAGVVADADLEQLFGLLPPDASVLSPPTTIPELQTWRLARLRKEWQVEDLGQGATDFGLPIVDPDVVQQSELVNPTAGQPAFDLWQSRTKWINDQVAALTKVRQGQSTDAAALNAVIAAVPVLTGVDLDKLQQQLNAGYRIDGTLNQCHLTTAGFRRIMELRALAVGGPLEPSEWDDVYAILVQVEKVAAYPQWRAEEQGRGLLLSPDAFTLAPPGAPVTLPQWRASWVARLAWADRLQARSLLLADLDQSLQAARFAAEEAGLPPLRDALVSAIGSGKDVSDHLTAQLYIDVESGASLKTTPLDQAIETLQSALEAIHTGAIASSFDDHLSASPAASWLLADTSSDGTKDFFETEWDYMGSYASWLGAMTTFFFPENMLDPSLLVEYNPPQKPLPGFNDWLTNLSTDAQEGNFDPQKELTSFETILSTNKVAIPPLALRTDLTENDLANFRQEQPGLVGNPLTYADIPGWALEVFFQVPLQLALALQRLGRYQEALDWLRTIYNHNAASSASPDIKQDQRAIFVGFGLDQGDPTKSLTRPADWLISDLNPHVIATGRVNPHLRYTLYTIARCLLDYADAEFTKDTPESRARARQLYLEAERVLATPQIGSSGLGVPPNPLRDSLHSRASANLDKLRTGLNIAGIQRPLGSADDPQGIPPPTPYRYATLVSRAQQLLTSAEDVERQYLAALQSKDVEQEKLLQASQAKDVALLHAQEMHNQEAVAMDDVQVFIDQQARANQQAQTYSSWISQGPNDYEQAMLADQQQANQARDLQIALQTTAAAASAIQAINGEPWSVAGGLISASADIGSGIAGVGVSDAEFHAQQNAFYGSLERQMDGWKLNQAMANWDSTISGDQIKAATGRHQVATEEANIADAQAQNAASLLTFLATKFTNVALYSWMVDVLGPIYRHQLQLATATALLAQRQLAFERQQRPPTFIKPDYVLNTTAPDLAAAQSGLTGSARLLSDLNDLNDYAYSTDQRKLQVTQSFSLAQLAPIDFIRFRGNGDMTFTISLPLFDQSFPGHYLRLIRRLRVSIVGLIPPTPGVRATLTSSGISSVVVPGDTFQTLRMARAPETVSYTSPVNATGTFELDAQPDLMNSFEGNGVDMTFRLTMPRAANPFNYGSLADVIVTYEYTAMPNADYARQVIRRMPGRTSNAIDFSLRQDFPDAWYALLAQSQANPAPAAMTAQLSLSTRDLPPNLSGFRIEQVTLMILRSDQPSATPVPVKVALTLTNGGQPPATIQAAQATSVDDIISTRSSAAAAWGGLLNQVPTGTWVLTFANDGTITGQALQSGDITDIVLVLTYGGDLPPWPIP